MLLDQYGMLDMIGYMSADPDKQTDILIDMLWKSCAHIQQLASSKTREDVRATLMTGAKEVDFKQRATDWVREAIDKQMLKHNEEMKSYTNDALKERFAVIDLELSEKKGLVAKTLADIKTLTIKRKKLLVKAKDCENEDCDLQHDFKQMKE